MPKLTVAELNRRVFPYLLVDDNGCWNWTRYVMKTGYCQIMVRGRKQYLHRVTYSTLVGPIPEGLQIDHLCRNRTCCNPEHLEAVTGRVNILRSENFTAKRSRQTHCIHGHPFDEVNTYIAPNGTRKCRTCRARVRAQHR